MSLATFANNCCPTEFADGTNGQALVMSGGSPTWTGPSGITIADAGSYFTTDNVEAALQQLGAAITDEGIQDAIGKAVSPTIANTGITYDDASGTFKFDAATLVSAAACATPTKFVGGDNLTYAFADNYPAFAVVRTSATFLVVTNPPDTLGAILDVPGNVTYTATLTNPHPCKNMQLFYWFNLGMDNASGVVNGNSWTAYTYGEVISNAVLTSTHANAGANALTNGGLNWGAFTNSAATFFTSVPTLLPPGQTATMNVKRRYLTQSYVANAANRMGFNTSNFGMFGIAI